MKTKKNHSKHTVQNSCFKPGKSVLSQVAAGRHLARASLLCAALFATNAIAQDKIAMVDHSVVAVSSSQALPVAVATVQSLENDAAAATSAKEHDNKSPVTGLEPGTLALIGFGLLALAATRRNAR